MPLVSAERLHRWKCPYCGSREKNIFHITMDKGPIENQLQQACCCQEKKSGGKYSAVKIVTCSRCGYVQCFAHSAIAMAGAMVGRNVTLEESEKFVHEFHHWNFDDPKKNPHAAENTSKIHNPGMIKPNDGNIGK